MKRLRKWMRVIWLGVALGPAVAFAAPPTNCSWPHPPDLLQSVAPGTIVKSEDVNQMRCMLNRIGPQSAASGITEQVCQDVTIALGARQDIPLAASAVLGGAETILTGVQDAVSPSRLSIDGLSTPTGSQLIVGILNKDADAQHHGKLCVQIIRP